MQSGILLSTGPGIESSKIPSGSLGSPHGLTPKFTLVIHGGSGAIAVRILTVHNLRALNLCLSVGPRQRPWPTRLPFPRVSRLAMRGTAIEAAEAAVRYMEDCPLFNAGVGSVYTHDGTHELDAAFMEGSVCGVRTVRNPVSLARAVMERSAHVMLAGPGAERFAQEQKLEMVPNSFFGTEHRLEMLKRIQHEQTTELDHGNTKDESTRELGPTGAPEPASGPGAGALPLDVSLEDRSKYGTVGCVCRDQYGNLAAATSTGGMTNKRYGRIGDSPVIGAGTYANNSTCAVSCTGYGEFFIRNVVAYDVSAVMAYTGATLHSAARTVVSRFNEFGDPDFEGGLIAVDAEGNVAMPFNSAGMYRGVVREDGVFHTAIWEEDDESGFPGGSQIKPNTTPS